jgi:hypothetical protein
MFLYVSREVPAPGAVIPPLGEVSQVKLRRLVFNLSKRGPLAMRLKWFAEKRLEPLLEGCTVSRNQAMGEGEACLVSRNDPMHDSVPYLRNDSICVCRLAAGSSCRIRSTTRESRSSAPTRRSTASSRRVPNSIRTAC